MEVAGTAGSGQESSHCFRCFKQQELNSRIHHRGVRDGGAESIKSVYLKVSDFWKLLPHRDGRTDREHVTRN